MPASRKANAKRAHRYQNETAPAGLRPFLTSKDSRRRLPLAAGLAAAILGAATLGLGLANGNETADVSRVASAADAGSEVQTQASPSTPASSAGIRPP